MWLRERPEWKGPVYVGKKLEGLSILHVAGLLKADFGHEQWAL